MEAKQWLLRARRLQSRIDQLEAARLSAWERATATTQRVSSDPVSRSGVSRKAEGTAELIGTIDEELRRLEGIKAEIVRAIAQVQDNTLSALLTSYYINGATWEETAVAIHYSYYRTVHDKHPQALAAISAIIEKTL